MQSTFSSADNPESDQFGPAVQSLSKMRGGVVKLSERGEAGLNSAANYYDQVLSHHPTEATFVVILLDRGSQIIWGARWVKDN